MCVYIYIDNTHTQTLILEIGSCDCGSGKSEIWMSIRRPETRVRVGATVLNLKLIGDTGDWKLRQNFYVTVLR